MTQNNNYYEVTAKCGHVGRKKFIPIKFAVKAKDGKEAAKKVREFPRVKHDHKDAIIDVVKIDYNTFAEIRKNNNNDPYLHCSNRKEQNIIKNLNERLEVDLRNADIKYDKKKRKERIRLKNKKEKILKEANSNEDYEYLY